MVETRIKCDCGGCDNFIIVKDIFNFVSEIKDKGWLSILSDGQYRHFCSEECKDRYSRRKFQKKTYEEEADVIFENFIKQIKQFSDDSGRFEKDAHEVYNDNDVNNLWITFMNWYVELRISGVIKEG